MENHQNQKQNLNPEEDLDNENENHRQGWGTWEELLLACAVNRHGFKDWDAVAMEVLSRTNRPNLLVTATHCEQRFHDLNRRFADQCNDRLPPPRQNGAVAVNSDHVPWLDKLRKLRVAELRRDVQRSDVSIMSLQLQVKTLEEEKAKENDGKEETKPDLEVSGEQNRPENDKTGGEMEEAGPADSEPETRRLYESTTNTDKLLPTTGDESDRENQSVNESNSTGSRFEKTGAGDVKLETGLVQVNNNTGSKEPDPVFRKKKSIGEESNNGSYDNEAKVPTCESVPPSEERKVEGDSSELHDSVTQSGEVGTRESGEVESSASLTGKRKTRRRKEVSGGEVAPEKGEWMVTKSEPLVGVLEMIKGHENISFFERRLESQDSDRYKDIVRQHVDLETIQLRLQKGHYSSCTSAFFRDILLLFINATVFFPHDSAESRTAQQLHRLVVSEMKSHGQTQSDPTPQKNDSLPQNTPLAKPASLPSKHNKASVPILVCRKRSSISVKPSSATISQKGDQQPIISDKKERPSSDAKQPLKPYYPETDEEEPPSPKTKEKPVTGARSLRRSNKSLNSNKKLPSNSTNKSGSSANKSAETPKPEKNKAEAVPDKKIRNAAADFLKRIRRNTSVEVVKSGGGGGGGSSSSSRGGGGGASVKEQKKIVSSGKGDKGKERTSRHNEGGGGSGSGDKRSKNIENNSQSKRSVGRPPKKAAETSNVGSAKRGRESSASAGKDKRPKKRSKK